MVARRLSRLLAVAGAIAMAPAPARAHAVAQPKRTKLVVEARRILVVVRYTLPAGAQPRRLRALHDRDRDGRLDAEEARRARRHLARLALLHLEVTLEGAPLAPALRFTATEGLDGAVATRGPVHATIVAELRAPWRRGNNRLRVVDRHPDRAIAVPLALFVAPPLVLKKTTLGRIGAGGRTLDDALLREGMAAEVVIEAIGPMATKR